MALIYIIIHIASTNEETHAHINIDGSLYLAEGPSSEQR